MNIRQAVKMAWKSIWGKKGRSVLTMLGIIIGIAAVMTIVSAMNGYTRKTMEQYEAMGSNQFQVSIWSYQYDEDGNAISKDYFPELYDYCNSIKEYVLGVTPSGYLNATVIYGTKNSSNMQPEWDDQGNIVGGDMPPSLYLGSDQYSICNNLTVAKGPGTCRYWTASGTTRCASWAPRRQRPSSAPPIRWARPSRSTGRTSWWWGSTPPG